MSSALRLASVEPRRLGARDHGIELSYDEFFEADPSLKIFRRDTGDKDCTPAGYPTDAIYKTLLLRGFKLPVTPLW